MNTPKRRVAKPRTHADGPRIKWSEFRPMYDYWGRELKRFYQLDTLSNAVDLYIRTKDRFIIQSIQTGIFVSGLPPTFNLIVQAVVILAILFLQSAEFRHLFVRVWARSRKSA